MFTPIRFLNAGESHGPLLTIIIEGVPAGLEIRADDFEALLKRRRQGLGKSARTKIEKDKVCITSGVVNYLTTGAPISIQIENNDFVNWKNKKIPPMSIPRPGHCDLVGAIKYNHKDLRISLERASARETATRVVLGAICLAFLQQFNIIVGGYVNSIGQVKIDKSAAVSTNDYLSLINTAKNNQFASPNISFVDKIEQEIKNAMKAKDTLGGAIEVVALNVPPGIGSYAHWDRRLDSQLAMALMSIQAMKGIEIADAFENSTKVGSSVHDKIFVDGESKICRRTNNCGGIEAGISNGMPIVARVAMKPISTILKSIESVDLASKKSAQTQYERSDFCAVSRAVVIVESMMSYVIANALLQKLGGDHMDEIKKRFNDLQNTDIDNFNLDNKDWFFNYQV